MDNQVLFNKSINILLQTYQDGTLTYTNSCGNTPVGHITGNGFWYHFFHTKPRSQFCRDSVLRKDDSYIQYSCPDRHDKKIEGNLLESGYSIDELAQIEWAFAIADKENILKAVMSVIDTLVAIHSATMAESDKAKSAFTLLPSSI